MIEGNIVENYQGKFAKIIRVSDDGLTHLSAWVNTRELADVETTSVSFLNDFGLSQVLKDGGNVTAEPTNTVIVPEAAPAAAEEVTAKKAKK